MELFQFLDVVNLVRAASITLSVGACQVERLLKLIC